MLFDVWHRRNLACAYVSESSLVAIVLLPPWRCGVRTATVSVVDDEEGSNGNGGMGKLGAGWPRIRWAMWMKDDVRRGFVCMSAVLSFP